MRLLPSTCLFLLLAIAGCSGKPSRLAAPEWDPPAIAKRAIGELDTDGNKQLSREEIQAAPGLAYGAKQIDLDNNGQLSAAEIEKRMAAYQENRTAFADYVLKVTYQGRPLAGADIVLLPEPCLGGVIEKATGTTDQEGMASVKTASADAPPVPVARPGYYRVHVTSPHVRLPAEYNQATTLGVELSPFSEGGGVIRLRL